MKSRKNPDCVKLKFIKVMKRKIFMACAALVVSATAVVGVKAYNYYSMPELMRANLEALTQDEDDDLQKGYKMARVTKEIKITSNVSAGVELNGKKITIADIEAGFYRAEISCCVSAVLPWKECPFNKQNKDC